MCSSLSLYLHFPFCASKCHYCDFYSESKSEELLDRYLEALLIEWDQISTKFDLTRYKVETIYFGGGTPSLLSSRQFSYICSELKSRLNLVRNLEWTVECNPDSFSNELADTLLKQGVNRLSFGIQTLENKELKVLGRRHSAEKARYILNSPSLSCFQSVGADLMFGIPLQTKQSFEKSLIEVLSSPYVKHLSLYELTINEDTPFGRHHKKLHLPDDDLVGEMTELSLAIASSRGFEHYEVSNYALPFFRSRHNEAYWDHQKYIGLGASAHSYLHPLRWSNIADTSTYINNCMSGKSASNFNETIDGVKLAHEILFLGLRRQSGINEELFKQRTGKPFYTATTKIKLDLFLESGYLIHETPWWRPTEKGMLFADTIARDLID
jgi:oxygen-independent coproporphyrinogen-3 oxidase